LTAAPLLCHETDDMHPGQGCPGSRHLGHGQVLGADRVREGWPAQADDDLPVTNQLTCRPVTTDDPMGWGHGGPAATVAQTRPDPTLAREDGGMGLQRPALGLTRREQVSAAGSGTRVNALASFL
jgi:hypothetical protein